MEETPRTRGRDASHSAEKRWVSPGEGEGDFTTSPARANATAAASCANFWNPSRRPTKSVSLFSCGAPTTQHHGMPMQQRVSHPEVSLTSIADVVAGGLIRRRKGGGRNASRRRAAVGAGEWDEEEEARARARAPSVVGRSAFLRKRVRALARSHAVALGTSPPHADRASLQSITPAPVRARSSLTCPIDTPPPPALLLLELCPRRAPSHFTPLEARRQRVIIVMTVVGTVVLHSLLVGVLMARAPCRPTLTPGRWQVPTPSKAVLRKEATEGLVTVCAFLIMPAAPEGGRCVWRGR